MKVILKQNKNYILKFEKGESYPEIFVKFLKKEKIKGGFFVGLGACANPEIAFYDLKKKKYFSRRFRGDFEVLSLTGNVAIFKNKVITHQHIALSGRNFRAIGGHLNKMKIGGTLEIFLIATPPFKRQKDFLTALNLLIH